MIIVDMQQVMLSSLLISLDKHTEINESLIRHMILNSLRYNNMKFKNKYGHIVIACDGNEYWRRDIFPYYKAARRKAREKSPINWNEVFKILNSIRDEIKEVFPYPVIHYKKAEADDIIATIVKQNNEQTLILSGDHDFIQLHNDSVDQYDPTRKKWVSHLNPSLYIKEHIIRGDAGDGVPNIMSKDNVFVLGERQRKIMTKSLEAWLILEPEQFCNETMLRNYHRNDMLINLNKIPKEVSDAILTEYGIQREKSKKNLFDYFREKKLTNLMETIHEFQ